MNTYIQCVSANTQLCIHTYIYIRHTYRWMCIYMCAHIYIYIPVYICIGDWTCSYHRRTHKEHTSSEPRSAWRKHRLPRLSLSWSWSSGSTDSWWLKKAAKTHQKGVFSMPLQATQCRFKSTESYKQLSTACLHVSNMMWATQEPLVFWSNKKLCWIHSQVMSLTSTL